VKTKIFLTMLLAAGTMLAADVSFGIQIGPPPVPRVERVHPGSPGPGYVWIDGYWYPEGGRYRWHAGYWTRTPYNGARWIVPRYEGGHFYQGYWEGDRGRVEHDHRWDRDRGRDYNRH
jgi:hypothetical protein